MYTHLLSSQRPQAGKAGSWGLLRTSGHWQNTSARSHSWSPLTDWRIAWLQVLHLNSKRHYLWRTQWPCLDFPKQCHEPHRHDVSPSWQEIVSILSPFHIVMLGLCNWHVKALYFSGGNSVQMSLTLWLLMETHFNPIPQTHTDPQHYTRVRWMK